MRRRAGFVLAFVSAVLACGAGCGDGDASSTGGPPADPCLGDSDPPGVLLTANELASALSFFLTDRPPDEALLDDAEAGTLYATLPAQVDRLLATSVARAWLTKVVETLYYLNTLPGVVIDPAVVPGVELGKVYTDMHTEAHLFVDDTLWNGNLADLLLSRTTYLNTNLATNIYRVPVPAGATETNFVRTTLPADQRSGILTNAGFLTTRARADGTMTILTRGLAVNALMIGLEFSPHPGMASEEVHKAARLVPSQTAQEQAAYRASMPECASCHVHFDPYGVALDNYDVIGRFRIVGDLGKPVDAHTKLGPELGGVTVANAVDLARVMAQSPAFVNGMARHMLQFALIDERVELPDPTVGAAGCAVADVARRFEAGDAKTFSALLRAVVLSPAFSLRRPAP